MARQWIVVEQHDEGHEVYEKHVVQGRVQNGAEVIHGHELSQKCDCCPKVEFVHDIMIVIHRWDA